MVSGKPPRRSKSSNEPVTIDLQAEETQLMPPHLPPRRRARKKRATDAEMLASDGTETAAHTETEAAPATDTIEADDAKSGSLPLETPRQAKGTPRWQPLRLPASLVASSPSPLPAACNMPAIYTRPVSHFGALHRRPDCGARRPEERVEGLRSAVSQGADTKQIEERLAALESAASQPVPAADTTGLDQVREQLTGLQSTLETLRTSGERRQPDFQSSRPASTVASPKSRKSLKNRGMTSRWPARSPSPD